MNIEEIKNRCENFKNEYLPLFNNNGEMREWNAMYQDNLYLLSIIEQAENEFNKIYSLANGLNANEVIIRQKADEALQMIRGN